MMFLLLTVLLRFVKGLSDSLTDEAHQLGLCCSHGIGGMVALGRRVCKSGLKSALKYLAVFETKL